MANSEVEPGKDEKPKVYCGSCSDTDPLGSIEIDRIFEQLVLGDIDEVIRRFSGQIGDDQSLQSMESPRIIDS